LQAGILYPVNIWIERFVLALLVAVAGDTILTNPWRLDVVQKGALVVAVAAIALFFGRTIEREKTQVVAGTDANDGSSAQIEGLTSETPKVASTRAPQPEPPPDGAHSRPSQGPSHVDTAVPDQRSTASPGSIQAGRDVIIISREPPPTTPDAAAEEASKQLRVAVDRVLRFPAAVLTTTSPRTTLETLLTDQRPRKLFDVLVNVDEQAIVKLPGDGNRLRRFLRDYYQFSTDSAAFEADALDRVGGMVAVRFSQGWRLYLRYALLRFGGMSRDEVSSGGNFLNFDITWDDAERVFGKLSADDSIKSRVGGLLSRHRGFVAVADDLTPSP